MSKLVQEAVQTRKRVREISEASEAPIVARKARTEVEPKNAVVKAATSKSKAAAGSKNVVAKKAAGDRKQKSSSVIYLGHIPHGFYEREISKFFSQFGEIKQLKLFRSQKTNGSKGYAFIKFSDPEVAVVSAEAMNGYFLNDRKLVCHVVAPEKLHKGMFANPKRTAKTSASGGGDSGEGDYEEDDEEEDEVVDKEKAAKRAEKQRKDMQKKMKRLAELGIDYEFTPSVSK